MKTFGLVLLLAVGISGCGGTSPQPIPPTPHMRYLARELCALTQEVTSWTGEHQPAKAAQATRRWYVVKAQYHTAQEQQEARHPGRLAANLSDVANEACDA